VLGPLPPMYRIVVAVAAVCVFVALGAWAAAMLPVRLVAGVGAATGAGLGLVAMYLLLRESGRDPARVRRPR